MPEDVRQWAEQLLGRELSDQENIQMLRQSGLVPVQIRDRLVLSYSSVRGENPSPSFDVTPGEPRTNKVCVIGEVERPSSYVMSSVATALTALYQDRAPPGTARSAESEQIGRKTSSAGGATTGYSVHRIPGSL